MGERQINLPQICNAPVSFIVIVRLGRDADHPDTIPNSSLFDRLNRTMDCWIESPSCRCWRGARSPQTPPYARPTTACKSKPKGSFTAASTLSIASHSSLMARLIAWRSAEKSTRTPLAGAPPCLASWTLPGCAAGVGKVATAADAFQPYIWRLTDG